MADETVKLTAEEQEDGWHFCTEWDDLLVGPTMMEANYCTCGIKWKTRLPPVLVPTGVAKKLQEASDCGATEDQIDNMIKDYRLQRLKNDHET